MVFAYVPATGTAGINTQLFIFAFLPEPFSLRRKGAGFLTPNPANGNLKGPPRHKFSTSVCLAVFPKGSVAPEKFCWEHKLSEMDLRGKASQQLLS